MINKPEIIEFKTTNTNSFCANESDINLLVNSDENVFSYEEFRLILSFPLNDDYLFTFKTVNKYYTRYNSAKLICLQYKQIYDEEEMTSTIDVIKKNEYGVRN